MAKTKIERVSHSVELDEELDLHIKGWKIQRVGWVLFAIFVIAAALGFFGLGPVSKQKVSFGEHFIEYEKYNRFEAETEIKLSIVPQNGIALLSIPQDYLESFEISKVMPQPEKQEVVNGNYQFQFLAQSPALIKVFLMPKKTGTIKGMITANNESTIISQYIYP